MDKEEMEVDQTNVEAKPKVTDTPNKIPQESGSTENGVPTGLEALFNSCRTLYPDQPNPLQVTALVKFWLGGPDPLDYISMYDVPGNAKLNIPPHWHYVSFGLSDIHGDGRVHEFTGPNQPSGFGFELTMRLKKEPTDKAPPTWPAGLMQSLAKYVFTSESMLCIGDHITWQNSLDGSDSRLRHMVLAPDIPLGTVHTPNGVVTFVQIVGITPEELRAVQHWNGFGVLDIMKRSISTGGSWFVNDMRRKASIYHLNPNVAEEIESGIEKQGSNLSGVSARITWTTSGTSVLPPECQPKNTVSDTEQIRLMLKQGLHISSQSTPVNPDAPVEEIRRLESLDVTINLESGALLPLALRGRLHHGRHFTLKSVVGTSALTMVAEGVSGIFCSPAAPYCQRGDWLQVYIPPPLLERMSKDLAQLADPDEVKVPAVFSWPEHCLTVRIVPEISS